jgi:hypothetical protein
VNRQPAHGGQPLAYLQEVIRRLRPGPLLEGKPDRLTHADRAFAAALLQALADDEDPRGILFANAAPGRPEVKQQRLAVAVDVAISCRRGSTLKGAVESVRPKIGLTESQIERALREHYKAARAYIDTLTEERLQVESEANDSRLNHYRKK